MSIFLLTFSLASLAIFVFMTAAFGLSLIFKRNDSADVAWGLGFIVVAITGIVVNGTSRLSWLVLLLVSVWGIRLSLHIFSRLLRSPEDKRYAAWRVAWGKWFMPRSYGQIFLLQGALLLIVSLPVTIALLFGYRPPVLLVFVAVLLWVFGFVFEAVADWQLKKFLASRVTVGGVMQHGLWHYSRHPNYFGEVTQWWGLWLMTAASPLWFLSILGPLLITFLILRISGVPMLEASYVGNQEYDAYKRRTSMFIPLPPRS
ncbi:MAG: DUF1295 domain-containing protein [Patescibacteria group bacterium]